MSGFDASNFQFDPNANPTFNFDTTGNTGTAQTTTTVAATNTSTSTTTNATGTQNASNTQSNTQAAGSELSFQFNPNGDAGTGGGFTVDTNTATTSSTAGTTAASGTTAAGATSSTQSGGAPAPTGDPSLRLKDKSVEEILNQWTRDLDEHVSTFTEQALRIRTRDQQLIEHGQKIMALQRNVQSVQMDQLKLTRVLETIKSNEEDLSQLITHLETSAEQGSKRTSTPDELRREDAYRLAEVVDDALNSMNGDLLDTISTLNKSTDSMLDPHHPITAVVKILNAHMTSLQYIESTTEQLEARLRTSAQLLHSRAAAPAVKK